MSKSQLKRLVTQVPELQLMQNELDNLRAKDKMQPTCNFRWITGRVYPNDGNRFKSLQQQWVSAESGNTEWRNVPVVEID